MSKFLEIDELYCDNETGVMYRYNGSIRGMHEFQCIEQGSEDSYQKFHPREVTEEDLKIWFSKVGN